jgi:hypothetical protein
MITQNESLVVREGVVLGDWMCRPRSGTGGDLRSAVGPPTEEDRMRQ